MTDMPTKWLRCFCCLLGLAATAPLPAATHVIGIYDYYFSPAGLQIAVGDTVTWHNYGSNAHASVSRAVPPLWDSGILNSNQEFSFTFTSLGTYSYYDPLWTFQDMKGAILVSPPNQPPAVSLTNPVTGAVFSGPTNLLLQAAASDSDGVVARVEFYANSTLLGVDSNAPFAIVASNLTAGRYVLTAVATDDRNGTATSGNVTISVRPVLKNPVRPGNGQFQVTLAGVTPGKTNILYGSENLLTWTPVLTNRPVATETNLTDSQATGPWRYYQVMQLP